MLLSAFHIKVPGLLERITTESNRIKLLGEHVINALGKDDALWWLMACVGGEIQYDEQDEWIRLHIELGFDREIFLERIKRDEDSFVRGWYNGPILPQGSGLQRVAQRLLSAATFDDQFD